MGKGKVAQPNPAWVERYGLTSSNHGGGGRGHDLVPQPAAQGLEFRNLTEGEGGHIATTPLLSNFLICGEPHGVEVNSLCGRVVLLLLVLCLLFVVFREADF